MSYYASSRWVRKRRVIFTSLNSCAVLRLVNSGTKRVRAKYRNALVLCSDDTALAMTTDGYGVVARLFIGWISIRLETLAGIVAVDSGRAAVRVLRGTELVLLDGQVRV